MFLSIHVDFIILQTYNKQFTLTTKNHCISSLNSDWPTDRATGRPIEKIIAYHL